MKSTHNMRVLLLAALAATAYGAICGEECVGAIFEEVAKAKEAGFADGDAAAYGYLLWMGYDRAGDAGARFVWDAFQFIGSEDACACGTDGCTKAKVKTCFTGASADDITAIDDMITNATAEEMSAEEKTAARYIFGVVSGQIAPDSEPAKKWTDRLTDAEMVTAIKVFNIVGAWNVYVQPVLDAAFAADADAKQACIDQVWTAIGYTSGTDDLAVTIANKGEEAFGADGLKSNKCFGEGSPAAATFTATIDGEAVSFDADNTPIAKLEAAKTEADTAISAQMKAADVTDTTDAASPAAVLSAAAAVIALML